MPSGCEESLAFLLRSTHFVELVDGADWSLDLRYATTNNFVGVNMYGSFNRAFLHTISVAKLSAALTAIRQTHPGYRFLIFDALRPRSVQRILWKFVVGTPSQQYIANPDLGSLHNFGFAVDLSLLDEQGHELDMGAGYDDFRPIAEPQRETEFLLSGDLSEQQLANRHLLRRAMEGAGFAQLPHEWWHFDALPKAEVRAKYQIVE